MSNIVPAERPRSDFSRELENFIRAGYQILLIRTHEETRVEGEIMSMAQSLDPPQPVITWDIFEAFQAFESREATSVQELSADAKKMRNPVTALDSLVSEDSNHPQSAIIVMRDLDDFMKLPDVQRRLKTFAEGNRLVNRVIKRTLIILTSQTNIPPKLQQSITVIDFSLPNFDQMLNIVDFIRDGLPPATAELDDDLKDKVATNLLGLTTMEAENCLSRCIVIHRGFSREMLQTIQDEKATIIRKGQVLTYIPKSEVVSTEQVGGYDVYMDWLRRRGLAYSKEARSHDLDYPRGCVLLGPPGTGKSMVAKVTCDVLGLPGYVLDVGSLFGSMVGESEGRTREALRQVEAQQGCVLVIDEADKALGNATTSQGDSGVTRRVFGTLLTWLAENKHKTFCIMTLNRTEGMPPELFRAGRFDKVWYTDLPNDNEKRAIAEIHFSKRGITPEMLQFGDDEWESICSKMKGFVGSEIEEAVIESRYLAFDADHSTAVPTLDQFLAAIGSIVPVSSLDDAGVSSIREFCKDRATAVTSEQPARRTRRRARNIETN